MQKEVLHIAQRIVNTKVTPIRSPTGYEPTIYVSEVDLSPINQGKVSIYYVEDWGQSGDEIHILHVTVEEFCDPKYLLDIAEEI